MHDYMLSSLKDKWVLIFQDNKGFSNKKVIVYSLDEKRVFENIQSNFLVELKSNS